MYSSTVRPRTCTTARLAPTWRHSFHVEWNRAAYRHLTHGLQRRERFAHDPAAALSQRDQILTQPVDVLLDRQAANLHHRETRSYMAAFIPRGMESGCVSAPHARSPAPRALRA